MMIVNGTANAIKSRDFALRKKKRTSGINIKITPFERVNVAIGSVIEMMANDHQDTSWRWVQMKISKRNPEIAIENMASGYSDAIFRMAWGLKQMKKSRKKQMPL